MNTSSNNVAVAILNWNGVGYLEQFLPTVIKHSASVANIYVIDNGSTDNSVAYLKTNFPSIKFIEIKDNYGFTGGYNNGIESIEEKYVILLNSDVEVTQNWIEPIIELMENDNNIAACQPKIKDFNNKDYFEYAGAAGGFIDKYGYPFCRGRLFDTLEKDTGQYDNNIEVFWATGACMFVRRDAFIEIGKLDANYFAHMEEIDLCWRLKNKDYKIMYCGSSTVYHVGGGTLQKSNPKKTYLNFRNNLLTLYKNLPNHKKTSIIFSRLILDGIAGIKFLLQGNVKDCIAVIKAHFSYYKLIKQYKTDTIKSFPSCVFDGNVVAEYFIKRKKKYSEL